ncbi:MAG: FHA domain-containing protein, partial [Deltaproteobacteria bacterium]
MDRAPLLRVLTGDGRIFSLPIKQRKITIGRNKNNDIVLEDTTVSRHHAEIVGSKRGFFLSDLGSYNGTKINGKMVQTAFLKHNDKIHVGLNQLIFAENEKAETVADSILPADESEYKNGGQQIVESSPLRTSGGSRELLVTLGKQKALGRSRRDKAPEGSDSQLTQLARSNKVLFVLYEISRQLNQIHDFNELLRKIMDLVFVVIDADYGFLVLTGDGRGDEVIPVVVKYNAARGPVSTEMRPSRTLIEKVIQDKVALLTSNAMADSRLDGAKSVMIQKIRSAMCVPLWRKGNIIGVIQLDSVKFDKQFTQDDLELLKAISTQMAMVIEQAALNDQIREEERMRSRLERFHSPQVIEMILQGGQEAKDNIMEPKELTATILFTDIIGFTRLSEEMPPREVNIILNRYFSRMSDI